MTAPCIHCDRPRTGFGPRGLCWTCYRTPEIKAAYPRLKTGPKGPTGPKTRRRFDRPERPVRQVVRPLPATLDGEPTDAEVEAFALWWEHEQRRLERLPDLPRVVSVLRPEGGR